MTRSPDETLADIEIALWAVIAGLVVAACGAAVLLLVGALASTSATAMLVGGAF